MSTHDMDDRAVEALLRGHTPSGRPELEDIGAIAADVRALGSAPAPLPTGALARLLEDGFAPAAGAAAGAGGRAARAAGSRRTTKAVARAATGLALVMAGVTGAAAADALPTPVQDRFASVVERTTAVDLPDSAEVRDTPSQHGKPVAGDAKDGGVDGRSTAERARSRPMPGGAPGTPRASTPSGQPDAPGQHGLDRAAGTPAGSHVPTAVPVPPDAPPRTAPRPTPHQSSTTPMPTRPTPERPSTAPPSTTPDAR